jgi:hypothetical protein
MATDTTLLPLLRQAGVGYALEQQLAAVLPRLTGPAPSAAAGANNGTSPPAPTVVTGSTDGRGSIQFGSGGTPAIGEQVAVTFASAYSSPPVVSVSGGTAATDALGALYPAQVSTTGFRVRCTATPAGTQAGWGCPVLTDRAGGSVRLPA